MGWSSQNVHEDWLWEHSTYTCIYCSVITEIYCGQNRNCTSHHFQTKGLPVAGCLTMIIFSCDRLCCSVKWELCYFSGSTVSNGRRKLQQKTSPSEYCFWKPLFSETKGNQVKVFFFSFKLFMISDVPCFTFLYARL